MRKDQQLGLDELMIVNPSSSGTESMFLGQDGTLYQVQGLGEQNTQKGIGQYVLGRDGSLYQVQGFETGGSAEPAKKSGENLGEERMAVRSAGTSSELTVRCMRLSDRQ
jgi:hypothetical protein